MRHDAFSRHQRSHLAIVNQSSFLLVSLTILHLAPALPGPHQFLILWLSATLAILGFQHTMDQYANPTPDLATILRNLAAYTPAQTPPQPLPPSQEVKAQTDTDLEEGEYDPEEYNPSSYDPSLHSTATTYPQISSDPLQPFEVQQNPPPPKTQQHLPHIPQHQSPILKYSPSQPPPATITTWPPALRNITTRTTSDPNFIPRIRHLISTQHTHERQWYASRLDLVRKLEGRDEKKRKLDSVLTSIGGKVGPSHTNDLSPEKELEIFDRKVHKACENMVAATTQELAKMEVPFFCTMKRLIGEKEERMKKGTTTAAEVIRLQGKMLELLEDLCGEEQGG